MIAEYKYYCPGVAFLVREETFYGGVEADLVGVFSPKPPGAGWRRYGQPGRAQDRGSAPAGGVARARGARARSNWSMTGVWSKLWRSATPARDAVTRRADLTDS